MTRRTLQIGGLALAIAASGHAAQADDFTITVPVEISHLTEDDVARVSCWVSDGLVEDPWDDGLLVIAIGHVEFPVPAREFVSRDVTVSFSADPPELARAADTFACGLSFTSGDVVGGTVLDWEACYYSGIDPDQHITNCGAFGEAVQGLVSGSL